MSRMWQVRSAANPSVIPGKNLSPCPQVQEDWFGTKDKIGSSNVHLDSSNLHLDLVPQELILVTAPKLQEDWLGTKISATVLLSLWVYLSLMPQDVTAPELQEVSLYQFILI